MPTPKSCSACSKVDVDESINESLDNFTRFYFRHFEKSADDAERQTPDYNELPRHGRYTRLLELHPGKQDVPISVNLVPMSLDDPLPYAALSYTWGIRVGKEKIRVGGREISVTENLWNALWHLRLHDKVRVLWVDALCINQSNIKERNTQVQWMKDIYEKAAEITAWLGPEGGSGLLAFSKVADIYNHYWMRWDRLGSPEAAFQSMVKDTSWSWKKSEANGTSPSIRLRPKDPGLSVLSDLFDRTWFHRVWIVQEGTVPVRTTLHLCHSIIPAEAVFHITRLLAALPPKFLPRSILNHTMYAGNISKLAAFAHKRSQAGGQKFPLLDVLDTLRSFQASDRRDKVYAALGFAGDIPRELEVEIDYAKPYPQVLRDAAVSCLYQNENGLRFLGFAGLHGSSHMPASWVPDWFSENLLMPFPKSVSRSDRYDGIPLFNACDSKNAFWKQEGYAKLKPSVNEYTLTVYGILVDFIYSQQKPIFIMDEDEDDLLAIGHKMPDYKHTGESFRHAYRRTMVADLKVQDPNIISRVGASMNWRQGKTPLPTDQVFSRQLLQQVSQGRKFVTTLQHDYMGLVPFWAEPGDAVFMLLGGEMLYVARPTLEGTYHYVGEAYIHGVMDGQVVQAFERGEGILQRIEFVPVIDNPKRKSQSQSTANPVRFAKQPLGYNIESHHYSNPSENLVGYVHDDIGPQIDEVISDIAPKVTESYVMRDGLSPRDAFTKNMVLGEWANVVESYLLQGYKDWKGKSWRYEPAGREFARRLYIRSALGLERGRHKQMWQAQVARAMVLQGQAPIIDGDECYRTARDYFMEAMDLRRTPKNQQTHDDEAIARALQEVEWYAPPPETSAESDTSPYLASPLPHSPPGPIGTRAGKRTRMQPSRPERLTMPPTRNPHVRAYKFKNQKQLDAFVEELKGYIDRGECPPVLSGRMVSDPSMRPKVEITTYGKPGDLRWEDEHGDEVAGPAFDEILGADSDSEDKLDLTQAVKRMVAGQTPGSFAHDAYSTRPRVDSVASGEWEGPEEAEVPGEFEYREEEDDEM